MLNTAAVLPSILKSFQNIFRGFCKYLAKRDEKHYAQQDRVEPTRTQATIDKGCRAHFSYLNKTHQKITSEHQLFKVAFLSQCCHYESFVARNLKFLDSLSLSALYFKDHLQISVFKHAHETPTGIHVGPVNPYVCTCVYSLHTLILTPIHVYLIHIFHKSYLSSPLTQIFSFLLIQILIHKIIS